MCKHVIVSELSHFHLKHFFLVEISRFMLLLYEFEIGGHAGNQDVHLLVAK